MLTFIVCRPECVDAIPDLLDTLLGALEFCSPHSGRLHDRAQGLLCAGDVIVSFSDGALSLKAERQ